MKGIAEASGGKSYFTVNNAMAPGSGEIEEFLPVQNVRMFATVEEYGGH